MAYRVIHNEDLNAGVVVDENNLSIIVVHHVDGKDAWTPAFDSEMADRIAQLLNEDDQELAS